MVRAFRAALVAALLVFVSAPASAQEVGFEAVLTGVDFPTNLAFTPDGRIFFTEKDTGRVRVISGGALLDEPFAVLPSRTTANETGLLGIAISPDFADEPWVYVYYSDAETGDNRVVRIRAEGDRGTDVEPVIDLLPWVSGYHNGGDLAFAADGTLFVSVGEAHDPGRAQDPDDLGGKILRIAPDGSVPRDDPMPGSPVYALGIRNSFGLCVDRETGDLWETENGPSEWDEVNRIEPGGNYGWPIHLGPVGVEGFEDPILAYEAVIVPTGCAHEGFQAGGGLYFGTYGGELHRVVIPGMGADNREPRDEIVARFDAGITDVASDPDGRLYVAAGSTIYVRAERSEPSATASPSAVADPGLPTGGGILIAVVLIAALVIARSRLSRAR